jgi:glycosyltransferase involved in cell wall biosynthesis
MSNLEILCTTMFQTDFSKVLEMNIQTDVVFANQDYRNEYIEEKINGNVIKMITSAQRGVGKNRNTALLYATGDICLFADDDMVYYDDYEKGVLRAFDELEDADIIIFNCDSESERKPKVNSRISRVRSWNFMTYGTYRIAVRRESILKNNIHFTPLFGGGARYGSGEDSLFLSESLKKGLKVYTHSLFIGMVKQEESTWFNGFNEKYLFDKGAWISAAFPKLKYILLLLFTYKFKRRTEFTYAQIYKMLLNGINGFNKCLDFDEWNRINSR